MAVTTIRGGRQIADATIPYIDIQNVTANTVLCNNTTGATSIQEVALSTNTLLGRGSTGNIAAISVLGLSFSGTTLSGIGGSTGSVDNAILRADGTGGVTVQSSNVTIDDNGGITLGTTSLSGSSRNVSPDSSAANCDIRIFNKGDGSIVLDQLNNGYILCNIRGNGSVNRVLITKPNTPGLPIAFPLNLESGLYAGSAVAGCGVGIQFSSYTTSTNIEIGAAIHSANTDLTASSEDFDLSFLTMAGGTIAAERLRILSTSQIKFNGYTSSTSFTGTAAGYLAFDSSGNILTVAVPSSGVSDGDKGDITVSGSGATWTIDNAVVTYAKIQNVAANTFLANATGSAATVQEIATTRIPLFSSAITGTPSASTYLRGDGSWATVSGGITTLNTLTAATQTFANDTNVTITSATSTHTLGWTGQLAVSRGGTGVSSVTTSPTASAFAGWDANRNISADNFIEGYTTTATAGGTTTLTVDSNYFQYFTGTLAQTVVLPVVTTLVNGFQFQIVNQSTGIVTVQTSGSNVIMVMGNNTVLTVTCINTTGGTGTASWSWTYNAQRTITTASTATLTPDITTGDVFTITAQAAALSVANPTGTPVNGQRMIIRIKDNGTARAITFSGAQYRASSDLAFPTTTIINRSMYLGFIWNSTDSRWDLLARLDNFA